MGEQAVRERGGRPRRADRPVFDLLASKLRPPVMRPGTVVRSLLIEQLAGGDARPIVSVVAPAGYGKTTLLAQWAERNGQAFGWVSVDEKDNDPKVLLSYVAEALNAVEPISERVFDALGSPGSSVPGSVVPRLCTAFASMTAPVGLVLAGRDQPPLRIARLRAEGRILEIGPGELALTTAETSLLLRGADLALGEDLVAELYRRTEGWAAGLYLAALYLREGGSLPRGAVSFTGQDRFISEYVEAEFLARLPDHQRAFLTRTSVLERMSGPLGEAVLELPGSAAMLAELARSNLLLVPLDRRGQWYRYHHLFRDMLLAELQRREPGLMPVLRRRAAGWYLRNGMPEEALEYSIAAEDIEAAARLVAGIGVGVYRQGRVSTVERWIGWLDGRGGIEGYPMAAVLTSLLSALTGRPVEAERWADAVDRWQYADA